MTDTRDDRVLVQLFPPARSPRRLWRAFKAAAKITGLMVLGLAVADGLVLLLTTSGH